MKKLLCVLSVLFILVMASIVPQIAQPEKVFAATTDDVTVTVTPAFVGISCNPSSYDFGIVAASATPSTAEDWATIDNTSTVQTDQTISVTTNTWAGGVTWAHSDTATAGADTAGLKANQDGTWGVGDIIIKNAAPNYIYENCPALTDYAFGIKLWAPTSYTDGVEKSITVRISAVAG